MNRVVEIPSPTGTYSYILLEDVILACLTAAFGSYKPLDRALIRVTRNADIDPDGEGVEEEEDYRQHMKRILKKRLRLQPVVLAVSGSLEKATLKTIRKALELSRRSVFTCDIPLNLGYVFGIEGKIPEHLRNELLFTPFKPQPNPHHRHDPLHPRAGAAARQAALLPLRGHESVPRIWYTRQPTIPSASRCASRSTAWPSRAAYASR